MEPWTSGCAAAGRTEQALRSEALASRNDNWTLAPGAAEEAAWPLPRGLGTGQLVVEQVRCPLPSPWMPAGPLPGRGPGPQPKLGWSGTAEPSAAGMGAPVAQVPRKGVPWGSGRPSRCRPGTCSHAPAVPLQVAQTIGLQTGEMRENWAPPPILWARRPGTASPLQTQGCPPPPQRSPQLRPQQPARPGPRAASALIKTFIVLSIK